MKLTGKDWVLAGLTGLALLIVLVFLGILLTLVVSNGLPVVSAKKTTTSAAVPWPPRWRVVVSAR